MSELSPFSYRKQLQEIKSLTPEEYERVIGSIEELKVNCKVYALYFGLFTTGFAYWQRRFIPKSFIGFGALMGISSGIAYGCIRTGWYFVEQVDSLGKDYEISRLVKQDIFDTRPDIDSSTRANYYMYQQKQHDDFEDQQKLLREMR